jgi:hypothetical protein
VNWVEWIEDRINDLLNALERIATALERIADVSEREEQKP